MRVIKGDDGVIPYSTLYLHVVLVNDYDPDSGLIAGVPRVYTGHGPSAVEITTGMRMPDRISELYTEVRRNEYLVGVYVVIPL